MNRERILVACRDLVLRGTPLPTEPPLARRGRRRPRSDSAREPFVAWLPLTVSQNRLAAIVGKSKESEIFGRGRAWPSKSEFEDDLRMKLVESTIRDDGLALEVDVSVPADSTIEHRQQRLTELVRSSSEQFLNGLTHSQTFLVGISARAGIASTPNERDRAQNGSASGLWLTVTERIRSSRRHYSGVYRTIADSFGLQPRGGADMPTTLAIFTDIVACAVDGLGQAAVYDAIQAPMIDVEGAEWTPLGLLAGTLLNQLFSIDGQPPLPALLAADDARPTYGV